MKSKKIITLIISTIVTIVVAYLIILFIYKFAILSYDFGYRVFAEDAIDREPGISMTVTIADGKSVMQIGELLEERGLIRNARIFYFQEMFSDYKGKMRSGEFDLNTAMTPFEMIELMSQQVVEEVE